MLRFHRYRGESNIDRSFRYFMQKAHYPDSVIFISSLMDSLKEIQLSSKRYLECHSVMPYYRMFCDRESFAQLAPDLVTSKAYYVRRMLQKQHPGIPTEQDELWYCPVCHSRQKGYDDIQIYHQIPEVLACADHHCYLKKVSINNRRLLQTPEEWDVSSETCTEFWLNGIAEDVKYIMDTKPDIAVDVFCDAFWNWFEASKEDVSFQQWIERVQQRINELPDVYRTYMQNFDFREFLTVEELPKLSGLGYLLLIRIMFGSFKKFVKYRF